MVIDGDYILINSDIRFTDVYEDKKASYLFFDLALRCDPVTHTYKFKLDRYLKELNLGEHEFKNAMETLRTNEFTEFYKFQRGIIVAYILPNDDLYLISNNKPSPPDLELLNITHARNTERGYLKFRKSVLERDNYKCTKCGSEGNLEVHHIKPFAKYPKLRTTVSNGITLCKDCHKTLHKGGKRSGNI